MALRNGYSYYSIGATWLLVFSGIKASSLIHTSDLAVLYGQIKAGDSQVIKTDWNYLVNSPELRDALPLVFPEM